jgi:TetR/AcrR family transcriptional regulator, cholesterol catabolism regulator
MALDEDSMTKVLKVKPTAKPVKASSPKRESALPDINAEEDIRDAVSRLKRERVIATAVELFHQNGFMTTTLEAVAEKMNVTKPFIYSHFKSKDALLAEICSRGIRSSLDVLNRVMASKGSSTEKLHDLARDFMLAVIENQGHIAIYNREQKHLSKDDSAAIDNMRREFDKKISALLTAGVSSREFDIDDVKITALAIGGVISWAYVWYRADGRLSKAETAEKIAGLILNMVKARYSA